MKRLLLVVVLIVVVGQVTITCGGGGGGSGGPTAPRTENIAGEWTGQYGITSFSGGGCYGADLAAHLAEHPTAFDWGFKETINQSGSVISARMTKVCESEDCWSCESSGSISGSTYTLTQDSCIGSEFNAPCRSSGAIGIQRMAAGNTGEETWNVFKANGDPAGVLTVRFSYTQRR